MTYLCVSSHNSTQICKLGQKWDSKKWGFYGIFWVPLGIQNFWKGSSAVPLILADVLDLVWAHWKLLRFRNLTKNLKNSHFHAARPDRKISLQLSGWSKSVEQYQKHKNNERPSKHRKYFTEIVSRKWCYCYIITIW